MLIKSLSGDWLLKIKYANYAPVLDIGMYYAVYSSVDAHMILTETLATAGETLTLHAIAGYVRSC